MRIEPSASGPSTAPVAVVPASFAARSLDLARRDRWEPTGGESALPLRLQLLNQVWLV
jgi:hypothetical protein